MAIAARYAGLPEYAFPRLRALLEGVAPGLEPLDFSIGEPKHAAPAFVRAILDQGFEDYRRYPPNDAPEAWRAAVVGWLGRRYGVPEARLSAPSGDLDVQPLSGTREGLFMSTLALTPGEKAGTRAAALLPNPFYPCYAAATLTVGAEPIYLSATPETGELPDLDLPEALLRRTAIVYLCSPSNPQGAIADRAYWRRLLELAERHDFIVFADECYSEIYRDAPPPGALEVLHGMGADPERLVVFHSLSKRSSLAGLRSGFAAGGKAAIRAIRLLRSYGGAPSPIPTLAAATAAWSDEAHVAENRARYAAKFAIADASLTDWPSYRSPTAGFFLWLPVDDGVAAARSLWRDVGLKALPGSYLSRVDAQGRDPGAQRIRLALVDAPERVEEGLTRLRDARGRVLTA